jgi:hypothetical protein
VSDFLCPKCGKEYIISDIDLWEVYECEGKETDFTCYGCEYDFIIVSDLGYFIWDDEKVMVWEFESKSFDELD